MNSTLDPVTAAQVDWHDGATFAFVCRHQQTGKLVSVAAQFSGNRETPSAMRKFDKLRAQPRHPEHEICILKRPA